MTHDDLVQFAARWLRTRFRCSIVLAGMQTIRSREQPDAIGWVGWRAWSVLIEAKASRADFRRDRLKPWRHPEIAGMGQERWYLAPAGVVPLDEVPEAWGLAEVGDGRVRIVRHPHHSVLLHRDEAGRRRCRGSHGEHGACGVIDHARCYEEVTLLLGAVAKVQNGHAEKLRAALGVEDAAEMGP